MKKILVFALVICLLLAGCGKSAEVEEAPQTAGDTVEAAPVEPEAPAEAEPETPAEPEASAEPEAEPETPAEPEEPAVTIYPLPDSTMDNLTDAMLAVSLEEGDAYVDDTGVMQMDVTIYTYDQYDMIDMAMLKVGDIIVRQNEEVEVTALDRTESGAYLINGGLEAGGFDLVTASTGMFFEVGFNDAKNWYPLGEATIRVSTEMVFRDNSDPDAGEVIHYPGSFLVDEITNYYFSPSNTTIRVEAGQIVEMDRIYIP